MTAYKTVAVTKLGYGTKTTVGSHPAPKRATVIRNQGAYLSFAPVNSKANKWVIKIQVLAEGAHHHIADLFRPTTRTSTNVGLVLGSLEEGRIAITLKTTHKAFLFYYRLGTAWSKSVSGYAARDDYCAS